jgi:hypothetical protein
MNDSKENWEALHAVILDELRFRVGIETSLNDQGRDNLADNLTDVVIANFDLTPRQS